MSTSEGWSVIDIYGDRLLDLVRQTDDVTGVVGRDIAVDQAGIPSDVGIAGLVAQKPYGSVQAIIDNDGVSGSQNTLAIRVDVRN